MKRLFLILPLIILTSLASVAGSWYVSPLGTDDPLHGGSTGAGAFRTIQYAISRATAGDNIYVEAGTYIASNTLIDKSLTIEGTGATRDAVVIVPAAEDGNVNAAFDPASQNGFIIKASGVTIRKLTVNGRGNGALTAGKNNFRAGIVTLDPSQPGGGTWNNLHIDNVSIRYAYRRGISVFPRSVGGTVIENSRVENVAYNQAMYLGGQSLVLNNTVLHCFQGIVISTDMSTPREICRVTGNTLSQISNFPGCYGDQGGGAYSMQPRAIEFDNGDPDGRTVEITGNIIDDAGSAGIRGTVGIYTRHAYSSSLLDNNTVTLTSGASWATGGSQSVGLLLGWSYDNGFTARNNHIASSGYGTGILIFGSGSAARPMILEANTLTATSSLRSDTADGTGIYIANQYLFASENKSPSCVRIRNHNVLTGYVRGIDLVRCANSTAALDIVVANNSLSGNQTGIDASTLASRLEATGNYWGGTGPKDGLLYPGNTGSVVSANVAFTPWWCDAAMTSSCPVPSVGMAIINTVSGAQYPASGLAAAFAATSNGDGLYVAPGTVTGADYNQPGKTVRFYGSCVAGQSILSGSPALTVTGGTLLVQGLTFSSTGSGPAISVAGGTLSLRSSILLESASAVSSCLSVSSGTADAGTQASYGGNTFTVRGGGDALVNTPVSTLWAVGNNWGSPTGPTIASNFNGTGGAITGAGKDEVVFAPFRNAPVTTVVQTPVCTGSTTVDIPVTVTNFQQVGSLSLTFGFTPSQLSNPVLTDINPAFAGWGSFNVTTDPLLLAAGVFAVSGFGSSPSAGVTLPDGEAIFYLHFTITGNSRAAVSLIQDVPGTSCEYAGVAPSHPFSDEPASSFFISGGMNIQARQKISGAFTYYGPANTPLLNGISVALYQDNVQVTPAYTVTAGTYSFSDLCPGVYEIRATSARPTDGSVNTTDAAQVNNWAPHPFAIEKVRFYAGDVTMENFLSATDAHAIQQHFVNGTAFVRPSWTFWNAGTTISANPITPLPDYPLVTLLPGNDMTVNMYGLCTGDFNRSFSPIGKMAASNTLSLGYGRTIHADPGQELELPVKLVNAGGIGAISLILEFPSSLVEILDVRMNGNPGVFDWAQSGNELRIGWHSADPVTFGAYDDLVILRLKTRETFTKGESIRFRLAGDPLNELADDRFSVIPSAYLVVDLIESSPNGIPGLQQDAFAGLRGFPNPCTSSLTLSYTLPASGEVSLDIINSLGVTVVSENAGLMASGYHTLNVNVADLPQGIYQATLTLRNGNGTVRQSSKIIVSR